MNDASVAVQIRLREGNSVNERQRSVCSADLLLPAWALFTDYFAALVESLLSAPFLLYRIGITRSKRREMTMNQHRYQFMYLPLERLSERMSGRGQLLLMIGKVLIVTTLVVLTLIRTNVI